MSDASCLKGIFILVPVVMRRVTRQGIKYQNTFYSHESLKGYEGTKVFVAKRENCLRVYDSHKKLICTAAKQEKVAP